MAGKPFFVKPLPFTALGWLSAQVAKPVAHLGEFHFPAMTWSSDAPATYHAFVVDLGSVQTIEHIAVLGANAQATTEVGFLLKNSPLNSFAADPGDYFWGWQRFIAPAVTDRDLYNTYADIGSESYRYVTVLFKDHSGLMEASKLIVGKKITSAKYYETNWEAGPLDLSAVTDNRNGIPDIASGLVMRQLSFTLGWMTESEWETSISPLLQACGKTEPVYCCFDPEATIYRQNRTYFGRLSESRASKQGYNRFSKSFDIKSFF